ncbi:hypothetical protein HQO82_22655 [Rhodococcus fascians]|nr:hypothetical protein [Rhodococcus fascians]MBY4116637.1 hypothetical protein [Rhodococcus fascians]
MSVRVRLGALESNGFAFLNQDSAFWVVAWTLVAYHGFEWTTETADQIRGGWTFSVVVGAHSCRSETVFGLDGRLRGWLAVTRLSQLDLADLFNLLDSRGLSSSPSKLFVTVPATVSTNPAKMIDDAQPRRAAFHADALHTDAIAAVRD